MKKLLSLALIFGMTVCLFAGCTKKPADDDPQAGKVYYLNFKPEANDDWQMVAAKYKEETGIEVKVVTAASGDYEKTLGVEIDKENPPTMFQVNGPVGLSAWKDYALDLSDSEVYKELISDDFALKQDGKVYGIAFVYEAYGLITNKKLLGDAGYTDEEGSFDCALVETDDEYIGYPAVNNVISSKKITVKKADYDGVLTKEDYVIGLHIPRNVDFSDEAIEASLRGAVPIIRERFPEWQPKMYFCSTWLNDPGLEALLGSESRIVKFGKRFLRYPGGAANGRGGYGFVFLGYEENEDLPEDTSLRRKLKAHYLNGGYTYFTPGIICDESYFGK